MNFDVLKEIDKYRKHPRFQVERHFDIFLIPYLPRIINHFYQTGYDIAVPEFPIRKSMVSDRCHSEMESISIDFALFDRTRKRIGCIELKTDNESNNAVQDKNMESIKAVCSAKDLLTFIDDRCKYKSMEISTYKFRELRNYLKEIKVFDCNIGCVDIYKITPHNPKMRDDQYLSFRRICHEIGDLDSDWLLIRDYLRKWDEAINVWFIREPCG
jgi:hypothetical protein